MSAPLSKIQKRYLCQIARRALNQVRALARVRGEAFDVKEEDWRHEEVIVACGKHGLRCCSQDDYKTVEAHFLDRLGAHGAAFNAQVRAATEKRRQAEAVLVRELEKAGLHLNYANAICQRQYRCTIFDATERQLWNLVYTVRNRAATQRRRARPSTINSQPSTRRYLQSDVTAGRYAAREAERQELSTINQSPSTQP
jgi:hypothetical protein